jgi:peptidoglycan/LPS O-acetylase OafA/YrhL
MNDQIANQHFKQTYVPAFDGLRGTVLTVMFVHLEIFCPVLEGHKLTKFLLFSQTWYTLNIFFCLSGFLITWLLVNEMQTTGQLNLWRFYKRRTVRLLPAYLSALIIACWLASLSGYTPKQIFHDSIYFLTYSYNIAISIHGGYFAGALGFFLMPAWSLCVEEQFYFVWSVALKWLKMKYALKAILGTLAVLMVYSCGLLYYMRHAGYSYDQIGARFYFGTDIRIDAILVGCAAALLLQNRKYHDIARKYLSASALPYVLPVMVAVIVFRTAQMGEQTPAYQLYGGELSMILLAAWFVSILFQPTSLVSRALASRPLVLLGRISYGLYIFHYLVIRLVARLLNISAPPYSVSRNLAAWFLVAVASTLFATVHFHLIELPLQRRFKGAVPIPDKPKPDVSLAPPLRPQAARASFATHSQHVKS